LRGKVLGVLTLGVVSDRGAAPEAMDLSLTEEFARRAALAIEHARIHQELQRINRAKDEFLATLSHELRTPLTAMLGWARILRTMDPSKAMLERGLETIERNVKAQGRIIEDLLDVSRIITGKLTLNLRCIDLVPVVESAIDVVGPAAAAKSILIETALDPGPCTVSGDPERLQQVFWNLLVNAVKFTPEGGRIEVRLARRASHAELTVADSGLGIDPEFLPHVFERFSQADGSSTRLHGGLGIGLAIVRHLVDLHGGSVRAESDGLGAGARFTVRLPSAVVREVGESKPRGRTGGAGDGIRWLDGLSVLLVDDDPDAREFLALALQQWGAEVAIATSADEALDAMDRLLPDVLVSDVAMPGKDGYALIRAVRSRSRRRGGLIPAVALTAYASAEDRIRILSEGFQMHVPKPIEPIELATVIARLVAPPRSSDQPHAE
jgi:signal transduction histidine kinase/ActR/RegA family two-component response regulator